jgi:hypothetical protein
MQNACKIHIDKFVGTPEGRNEQHGESRRRYEDNIEMDIKSY